MPSRISKAKARPRSSVYRNSLFSVFAISIIDMPYYSNYERYNLTPYRASLINSARYEACLYNSHSYDVLGLSDS